MVPRQETYVPVAKTGEAGLSDLSFLVVKATHANRPFPADEIRLEIIVSKQESRRSKEHTKVENQDIVEVHEVKHRIDGVRDKKKKHEIFQKRSVTWSNNISLTILPSV
jgi:hypothetical protein